MRTRKAERIQRKAASPVRLMREGSELQQAIEDFKNGVPGGATRMNEILGGHKRPGRKRPVIGDEE